MSESIHMRASSSVSLDTRIELMEIASRENGATAVSLCIRGSNYEEMQIALGVGWVSEEDTIEVAGRLINVLEQASENARDRIAARLAVPA